METISALQNELWSFTVSLSQLYLLNNNEDQSYDRWFIEEIEVE